MRVVNVFHGKKSATLCLMASPASHSASVSVAPRTIPVRTGKGYSYETDEWVVELYMVSPHGETETESRGFARRDVAAEYAADLVKFFETL